MSSFSKKKENKMRTFKWNLIDLIFGWMLLVFYSKFLISLVFFRLGSFSYGLHCHLNSLHILLLYCWMFFLASCLYWENLDRLGIFFLKIYLHQCFQISPLRVFLLHLLPFSFDLISLISWRYCLPLLLPFYLDLQIYLILNYYQHQGLSCYKC